MDEDDVLDDGGGEDMGVIILMLALYLIVLAFFILLNAISEDSKSKMEMAVKSVNEGFSWKTEGEKLLDDDSGVNMLPIYEHVNSEVEGVLETYLALRDYFMLQKEQDMYVSMRPYRFFNDGEIFVLPEMKGFFDEMASVLSSPRQGYKILTEIRVASTEVELGDLAGDMSTTELAGRRATLFTRALINRGVPAKNLSAVSVSNKRRGEVVMHFQVIVTDQKKALDKAREVIGGIKNLSGVPNVTAPNAQQGAQ